MSGLKIIVDDEEPAKDVDEPTFDSSEVQVRRDRWICDEFEILDFLGRGKFGEVKRCSDLCSRNEYAAKFICTPRPQDKRDVEHEVNMMRKLRHRRLVQLYDAFESRSQMCIVLEIIYGGELFERVVSDEFVLTEKACVCFIRQICEGVEYIHSRNIIHLDLKPENVMCLTKGGNRVKIIDFGLAREFDPNKDTRVLFGTPEFMAPEVILFDPINFATDMWSIGAMSYVLLSGLSPFMGNNDTATLCNVTTGKYDFNYPEFLKVSDSAKDFIRNLLKLDKTKRMTATMCLEHAWLKNPISEETLNLDLSKEQIKAFIYRRKWQKAFHVIVAVKRMRPSVTTVQSLHLIDPQSSIIKSSRDLVPAGNTSGKNVAPLKNIPTVGKTSNLHNHICFGIEAQKTLSQDQKHISTSAEKPVPTRSIVKTKSPKTSTKKQCLDSCTSPDSTTLSSRNGSIKFKPKASKDNDLSSAHQTHDLVKQSNRNNLSSFIKLRNMFSNNRT